MSSKQTKIPDIKIGYQSVSVQIISDEHDRKLDDVDGYYQRKNAKICVNIDQCVQEQTAALWHECLHAAFYTYGMCEVITDKEREEYIVNTLANALLQVLKDNPHLVKMITYNGK